jgi:multiple sugar transport system substrate-binding protein
LRLAGAAAAAAAFGGGTSRYAFAGPLKYASRSLKGSLSIVQWRHVVPDYDTWFDDQWATTWGEGHDVEVTVDHIDYTQLPALAAAEAKARRGHDIFGFLTPPSAYQDQVIDHSDIVTELEHQIGGYSDLGKKSTYNPKTKKYFGVSDSYVPDPVIWRHDLWNSIGEAPATWEHVLNAAPKLQALGHPIGIGQSNDPDSNIALTDLMMAFGSFLQDESGRLTIGTKNTIEAVRFIANLAQADEPSSVYGWDATSNNELLLSGTGSLIINAISATRTADTLALPFAPELWIWPLPAGPHGRLGLPQYTNVYSIWNFAKNQDAAQQFLADFCLNSTQACLASQHFNFPSFPGSFPLAQIYTTAANDPSLPHGKYTILTTVANKYTRNLGFPGYANPAVDEVMNRYLIPQMFAQASQGKLTPEESVGATTGVINGIWEKWKTAGTI